MQRQIPAVLRVLRASGPVPRQNGGHSSYATVTVAENCGGSAVAVPVSRNALFDSRYIFCVSEGRISGFLREWVDSAPEVDSRPALHSSWPRTSSTTAVACFIRVLLVLTHLALCSGRLLSHRMEKCAQSMLRPPSSFFIENLDIISISPLYFAVFSAVGTLRWVIFRSPRRRRVLRCRGLGRWRGRRESDSQVTRHQLVSVTHCIVDVM